MIRHRTLVAAAIGMIGALALAGAASADGMAPKGKGKGSLKDGPGPADGRQLSWTVNIGGTTDYVFRGVSQSFEDAAFQAGVDVTYGIFYIGAWGSGVNFADDPRATAEIDWYAGIKPVWGPLTFDLGVIYYSYPGSSPGPTTPNDPNYVELKAGVSGSPVDKLTLGGTVFWSPDYIFESGSVWTFEGAVSLELPKIRSVTPTFSALIGYQTGDLSDGYNVNGLGDDDYLYWNVGLALAFDKLTLDFRYWDSDIGRAAGGTVCAATGLCDERFVFSAKVTLP